MTGRIQALGESTARLFAERGAAGIFVTGRNAERGNAGPDGLRADRVLFVLVLGASNLTYVEPVLHQDLETWIGCHVRAFEYFGDVPAALVPDNTKGR